MKRPMSDRRRRQLERRDRPSRKALNRYRMKKYKEELADWRQDRRKELRKRRKDPYKEGKAATPGKKAPFVKPFMNADDLMDYAQAHERFAQTLNDADFRLEDERADIEYGKSEIARDRAFESRDASDELAARGLFQSSIRDSELNDIDATAALRQNDLDRRLDIATLQTQTQKLAAQNAWDAFQRGMNQKQVQNAQEIMANTPKYLVDPTKATKASGYKPKPIRDRPNKPRRIPPGYHQGGGGTTRPQSGGGNRDRQNAMQAYQRRARQNRQQHRQQYQGVRG